MAAISQGRKRALVLGSTGVVGSAIVDWLATEPDWDVVCATRRPAARPGVTAVPLDLLDPAACERSRDAIGDVSHLIYAAYQPRATRAEEIDPNLAMLANGIDVASLGSRPLEKVVIVTGAKFYGIQWGGAVPTPCREDQSRDLGPNFYHAQEDLLRGRSGTWSWTNLIPPFVTGYAIGNPMNLATAIGVYGSLSRELGLPLHFPGTEACYRALHHVADADQIAAAASWAANSPAADNARFNVANGDPGRWQHVWPAVAAYFELIPGEIRPLPLSVAMPARSDLWSRLVERHGLLATPIGSLVDWNWADYMFRMENDVVLEIGKIRRAGFNDCVDTVEALLRRFDQLRRNNVIP